jgi:Golgi SNAP receptor complex protein 2
MSGQRERLKRAHKKALDMLNKIGLSESLLKIAERRQKVDKMIVYGGMAGVSLLVLLVWWVVRTPAAGSAA